MIGRSFAGFDAGDAGRIRQGPAPRNLDVPPYKFVADKPSGNAKLGSPLSAQLVAPLSELPAV